jgi:integrase
MYVEPSKRTLRRFLLDEWLPAKVDLRPSTSESYRRMIDNHIVPTLGDVRLQELATPMLSRLYRDLLESGRLVRGKRLHGLKGLSPRTVAYVHGILVTALGDAVAWGFIARNPAASAKRPRVKRASPKTWNADELRAFLASVKGERHYSGFYVAAMTGVRRGELLGLRWSDLDLDSKSLHVRQTVLAVRHKIVFGEPKTARGRRQIALDPATVELLKEHRKRQAAERLAWGPAYAQNDLVFAREDGSPVHPESFAKVFGRRVAVSGLPRLSFHGLRHTHASILLAARVNPKVVSERLGHASVAFTLDIYSHAIPDLQEEAAEKAAAMVLG